MDLDLQSRCDLFIRNYKALMAKYKMSFDYMTGAAVLLYTLNNYDVNVERIDEASNLIKKNTGLFSDFRGNEKQILITKMVLSDDMEGYLTKVIECHNILKKSKSFASGFSILLCIQIVDKVDPIDYEKYINKTKEVHEMMKKNHKWITAAEDTPFAAMLAIAGKDIDVLEAEMEEEFNILVANFKKTFVDKNCIQTISHVLCLVEGDPIDKCNKVSSLYNALKNDKRKVDTYGVVALATLTDELSLCLENISAIDDYLSKIKEFSRLKMSGAMRRMYAIFLSGNNNVQELSAMHSTLSMTIAAEMCMMLICMTTLNMI